MQLIRRECFWLFALATGAPLATQAWAQGGPKLSQILRHDLENQDYTVQETVASMVEFPTGSAAPWHHVAGIGRCPYWAMRARKTAAALKRKRIVVRN
jgi:hypothetical protein